MWNIGQYKSESRFMLGSSGYATLRDLIDSIKASKTEILTVSLRRSRLEDKDQSQFIKELEKTNVQFLSLIHI